MNMSEFERLLELKQQYDELDMERADVVSNKKAEIIRLQNEIAEIEEPFKKSLAKLENGLTSIKEDLLENWDYDENIFKDETTGINLQRRKREKADVHDLKALLTQVVTFDEMPIKKVTWDNKTLKALISAGVVKKDIAEIQLTHELAVTYPKPE